MRPHMSGLMAHVLSTLLLCAAIILMTGFTLAWIRPQTRAEAGAVGIGWLVLTVGFEFLAGHYLFQTPWPILLEDYHLLHGRVWLLVLLILLCAPPLCFVRRQE